MEPLVDIVIEDARWEAFGLEARADLAVRAALAELGLPEVGFTLCVMGCDDAVSYTHLDVYKRQRPD